MFSKLNGHGPGLSPALGQNIVSTNGEARARILTRIRCRTKTRTNASCTYGLVGILVVCLIGTSPLFAEKSDNWCSLRQDCNLPCSPKDPDISIKRFQISGTSLQKLRSEIKEKGPVDQFGSHCDAYTKWNIKWNWPVENKTPNFSQAEASLKLEVSLPEAAQYEKFEAAVKTAWDKYLCSLLFHEQGHIDNATINYQKVSETVKKAASVNSELTWQEANSIAKKEIKKIRAADLRYDKETESGALQGVTLTIDYGTTGTP